jgi:DNA-binding transcriptional MocR family regulator
MMELDQRVRLHIYKHFRARSQAPAVAATANALGRSVSEIIAAYRRLAAAHIIVLRPGTNDIWMAMPFSTVPTAFRVHAEGRAWWANCAWDALGIPAMLHADGHIETTCADCGTPMTLTVSEGALVPTTALVHFAVPAAHWWDNIGYT